jgi:hypothetical protein
VLPNFSPHLTTAQAYWKLQLDTSSQEAKSQWVIDATCGNGHDTLFLAQNLLKNYLPSHDDGSKNHSENGIISLDIQKEAIESTWARLKENFDETQLDKIHLYQQSHASFPAIAFLHPIKLIVYNLGYLPGSDKKLTTLVDTTLTSLEQATQLIIPGGMISVMCYPGHPEGKLEEQALLNLTGNLPRKQYLVCYHQWINKSASPSLILIKKLQ